jgi:hypothetical protein
MDGGSGDESQEAGISLFDWYYILDQFGGGGGFGNSSGGRGYAGDGIEHGGGVTGNNQVPRIRPLPIFSDEYFFPEIEAIDYEYWQIAPVNQKIFFPAFPDFGFLLFQYEANAAQQNANSAASLRAYKGVQNTNPVLNNLHEVPYASTKQGGKFAIRRIVNAKENQEHGIALRWFYSREGLKDGDYFLVPLYKPTMKSPGVIVSPKFEKKPSPPSVVPVLIPIVSGTAEGFELADLLYFLFLL